MKLNINTGMYEYVLPVAISGTDGYFLSNFRDLITGNELKAATEVFLQFSKDVGGPSGWEVYYPRFCDGAANLSVYNDFNFKFPRFVNANNSIIDIDEKSTCHINKETFKQFVTGSNLGRLGQLSQPSGGSYLFCNTLTYNDTLGANSIFNSPHTVSSNGSSSSVGEWINPPIDGLVLKYQWDSINKKINQYIDDVLVDSCSAQSGVVNDATFFYFPCKYGYKFQIQKTVLNSYQNGISQDVPLHIYISGVYYKNPLEKCTNPSCNNGWDEIKKKPCQECFGMGWKGLYPTSQSSFNKFDQLIDITDYSSDKSFIIDKKISKLYNNTGNSIPHAFSFVFSNGRAYEFYPFSQNVIRPNPCSYQIDKESVRWVWDLVKNKRNSVQPGIFNISLEDSIGYDPSEVDSYFDNIVKYNYGQPSYSGVWPSNQLGYTPVSKKPFEAIVNSLARGYIFYATEESHRKFIALDVFGSIKTNNPVYWEYSLVEDVHDVDIVGYRSASQSPGGIGGSIYYSPVHSGVYGKIDRIIDGTASSTFLSLNTPTVATNTSSRNSFIHGEDKVYSIITPINTSGYRAIPATPYLDDVKSICKIANNRITIDNDDKINFIIGANGSGYGLSLETDGLDDIVSLSSVPSSSSLSNFSFQNVYVGNFNNSLHLCRIKTDFAYHISADTYNTSVSICKSYFDFDGSILYADIDKCFSSFSKENRRVANGSLQIPNFVRQFNRDVPSGGFDTLYTFTSNEDNVYAICNNRIYILNFDNMSSVGYDFTQSAVDAITSSLSSQVYCITSAYYYAGNVNIICRIPSTNTCRHFSVIFYKDGDDYLFNLAETSNPSPLANTLAITRVSNDRFMVYTSTIGSAFLYNADFSTQVGSTTGLGAGFFQRLLLSDDLGSLTQTYSLYKLGISRYPYSEVSLSQNYINSKTLTLEKGVNIPHIYTPKFLFNTGDDNNRWSIPFLGRFYSYATEQEVISKSIPDNNILAVSKTRSGSDMRTFISFDPNGDSVITRRENVLKSYPGSSGVLHIEYINKIGTSITDQAINTLPGHFIELKNGEKLNSCRGYLLNPSNFDISFSPQYVTLSSFSSANILNGYSVASGMYVSYTNSQLVIENDYSNGYYHNIYYATRLGDNVIRSGNNVIANLQNPMDELDKTFYTINPSQINNNLVLFSPSGEYESSSAQFPLRYGNFGLSWPSFRNSNANQYRSKDIDKILPIEVPILQSLTKDDLPITVFNNSNAINFSNRSIKLDSSGVYKNNIYSSNNDNDGFIGYDRNFYYFLEGSGIVATSQYDKKLKHETIYYPNEASGIIWMSAEHGLFSPVRYTIVDGFAILGPGGSKDFYMHPSGGVYRPLYDAGGSNGDNFRYIKTKGRFYRTADNYYYRMTDNQINDPVYNFYVDAKNSLDSEYPSVYTAYASGVTYRQCGNDRLLAIANFAGTVSGIFTRDHYSFISIDPSSSDSYRYDIQPDPAISGTSFYSVFGINDGVVFGRIEKRTVNSLGFTSYVNDNILFSFNTNTNVTTEISEGQSSITPNVGTEIQITSSQPFAYQNNKANVYTLTKNEFIDGYFGSHYTKTIKTKNMNNEELESWSYSYASGYVDGSDSPPFVQKRFNNKYENIDFYPVAYSGIVDNRYRAVGKIGDEVYYIAFSGGLPSSGLPVQENNQPFDDINVNNPIFWNGYPTL